MRETILNIIKIITFGFIFLIIFVFLTYMKKPNSVDLQNITGFYAEERNSLDMVYIGGSAAFVYWEPLKAYEEYGIASYDFGANTIQAEFYEYMIKEILSRQNPELIVIDARAFQYRDIDQPPSSVAYRNVLTGMPFNLNKIQFIEENVPKYLNESTKTYHFDLSLYHTSEGFSSIRRAYEMIFHKYSNDLKGFFFVPKAARMKKMTFKTSKIEQVSEETTQILDDLLEYLKTEDVNVLFVVSPYIETKTEKANFNFIEKKVKEAGFGFLDSNEYSKEMNIDYDTDFYNYNHVNIYGADKYTSFLSEYMKSNYNMPDRRDNSDYSDWDDLLDNWNSLVDATKSEIDEIINGENYDKEIYIKE